MTIIFSPIGSFVSRSQQWQSLSLPRRQSALNKRPRTRSSRASISRSNGRAPSSLRQADDGTFYGTTSFGGAFDKGTLFRMDATGVVTALESFSGPLNGARPFGLVRASDGRFYGMTAEGGAFGFGTVFRFVPGGVVTTLHAFSESGRRPLDLFPASDGNVYGLTAGGGDFDNGTIFVIDPGGSFRTIHSFPSVPAGRDQPRQGERRPVLCHREGVGAGWDGFGRRLRD